MNYPQEFVTEMASDVNELTKENKALRERNAKLEKVLTIVSNPLFSTDDHKDYKRLQEAIKEAEG